MITSRSYAFLKLLHVAIFTFAGIFAVKTIINGLNYSCEKKNLYPKIGMNIFKIWVLIIAFVSSQLAWNLRPFVGSRDLPFELFREHTGNFYVAVIQSAANLFQPAGVKDQDVQDKVSKQQNDTTLKENDVRQR
jgi:hypothetical protein